MAKTEMKNLKSRIVHDAKFLFHYISSKTSTALQKMIIRTACE